MKKQNKGITLIALVITIIVLLILAGVAISTLTGENGILTQANNAKDKTKETEAVERVKLEVAGSYETDGSISIDELNKNLKNLDELTYYGQALSNSNKIESLPTAVTLYEYVIFIDVNGSVYIGDTLENAINSQKIYRENTKIIDKYGNIMVIPAGFKITSDSAIDVTGGIVIEDATYENTKGSQFVWIPVGDIYTDEGRKEDNKKTIKLSRYIFADGESDEDAEGNLLEKGTPIDKEDEVISIYQELEISTYGNAVAKDIKAFLTSANNNHGYYFGRYEAGVIGYEPNSIKSNDNAETNWTGYTNATGYELQLVCKIGQQVWNWVTQSKASELSRNMYRNTNFTSDLVNSYAWDTATVFIQEFSGDKDYSRQTKLQTTLAKTGEATDGTNKDVRCNIYDMAGNTREWTTESVIFANVPCVYRGGYYNATNCVSNRNTNFVGKDFVQIYQSFRPLLYL